ncbi:MAG: hypothetical protein KF787_07445 [Phycisphaeraceae bacterium]|nr:hypothetical protein [Phycisphaerae bacterium]MBX3392468.1 hypothetical protein [Phycisphaeraceae bacterium]HRJ49758.1 hypothetical protein [Phycisphaerales bacterium]
MHILTKILMVFAAVLAIFLSALTIAYSANTDKIVADYAQASAHAESVSASSAVQVTQASEIQNRMKAEIDQISRRAADFESRINELQRENAGLRDARARAEARFDSIEGEKRVLTETANTQAKLLDSYRSEVGKLLAGELAYRKRELELDERISELESQREVLQANVRALQEQLTESRMAMGTGAAGTLAISTGALRAAEPFTITGPLIRTRVDRVTTDAATGSLLAQVPVGSAGNIRSNAKLFIVRDGVFLANLIIVQADINWSVGRVDSLGQTVEIRPGDEVFSRLTN